MGLDAMILVFWMYIINFYKHYMGIWSKYVSIIYKIMYTHYIG